MRRKANKLYCLLFLAHGTGFVRPESGECRCIKGEIVCAKPQGIRVQQQQGRQL